MKNTDIGFWEIVLICITAIVIAGMITGYDVDVGGNDGCVTAKKRD